MYNRRKPHTCELEDCQECCPHDDVDHHECLSCGKEMDPGEAIDKAMDYDRD